MDIASMLEVQVNEVNEPDIKHNCKFLHNNSSDNKRQENLTFIFSSNTQCDIFEGAITSLETLFSRRKQLFQNDVWSRWVLISIQY